MLLAMHLMTAMLRAQPSFSLSSSENMCRWVPNAFRPYPIANTSMKRRNLGNYLPSLSPEIKDVWYESITPNMHAVNGQP